MTWYLSILYTKTILNYKEVDYTLAAAAFWQLVSQMFVNDTRSIRLLTTGPHDNWSPMQTTFPQYLVP